MKHGMNGEMTSNLLYIGPLVPMRSALLDGLQAEGVRAEVAPDAVQATPLLDGSDVVLFGAGKPGELSHLKRLGRFGKPLALILGPEDKALAPSGLRAGARTVLVDQVHPEEVLGFVRMVGEEGLLRREVRWLRSEREESAGDLVPIGRSAAAERLRRAIQRTERTGKTVILRGEKGSNFFQIARVLHLQHPGHRYPLLHWEAARDRASAIKKALEHLEALRGDEGDLLRFGGTLFVADAQALSPELQERLASLLENAKACPGFRLILGLTHDPERLFQDEIVPPLRKEGRSVLLRIPPLRERRRDIPDLAGTILDEFSRRVGQESRILTPGATEWISAQPWWGNESQLEVCLWRAFLMAEGNFIALDEIRSTAGPRRGGELEDFFRSRLAAAVACLRDGTESDLYAHTIRSVERPLLELVLRECGGNQLKASRLLGMNRNTLRRRLQELGLTRRARGRERG